MSTSYSAFSEGEFVPPGHFYSVVPSAADRRKFVESEKTTVESVPGINLNSRVQLDLLEELRPLFATCPFPHEKKDGNRYFYLNPAYSYGDALTLQAVIRHFAPRRIIEIGSGYSSAAILDTNEQFFGSAIDLTFIEPYPELLLSLMLPADRGSCRVIPHGVQSVELDVFDHLGANDILFVDSTHVSKLGSDVNRIFFEIFPRLNPGVLIHIHDIFWPFEYPAAWIEEGRAWNEIYLLRAMLQFNAEFEILFFADYLRQIHQIWFSNHAEMFTRNSGGNLWMRRCNDRDRYTTRSKHHL